MKITKGLVKHLMTLGLDAKHDAAPVDAEIRSFVGKALAEGTLSVADYTKLSVDEAEVSAKGAIRAVVAESLGDFQANMLKQFGDMLNASRQAAGIETKAVGSGLGVAADILAGATGAVGGDGSQAGGSGEIRVKQAVERYSHNRSALLYTKSSNVGNRAAFSTMPVQYDGRNVDEPSNRDKAICGAWYKHMINRFCKSHGKPVPRNLQMTEHDKALVQWAVHNSEFVGPVGNRNPDSDHSDYDMKYEKAVGNDLVTKALLDDSTSGGLEAVPIEFDSQVIMTALLNGELFPLVNWQTVSRRRIEGYSMGEFTFASTSEGTAITPFTTTSFIAAFDTTIYPIVGAVEVGLDFLDDAPVDIAGQIQTRYGDGFLKKMDELVAYGSGTGEITGLFSTSGLVSVSASSGSLPYKTADVEGLLFGVAKPYRSEAGTGPTSRAVFVSNDTVYRRFRNISWGTETNLRAFGMDFESYMVGGHPWKVNAHSSLTSAKAGFFCMNRFKGYRRAGFQVRIEAAGATNALKNQETIVVRARYGGQMSIAAAGAVITDLPTS